MKKSSAHTLIAWISYAIILMLYFGFLFTFGSNTPQTDEFFDALVFLDMYHKETTFSEKVAVFFWQYTEHIQVISKLIWLAHYNIFGGINFFPILVAGAIQLPVMAYLISHIFNKKSEGNYSTLISLLIILSPSIWLNHLAAGYTTIAFPPIFFSVLLIYLLQKQKIICASFALLFPAFAIAGGVFIVPIATAYLWTMREIHIAKKLSFTALAFAILTFYFSIHISLEPFGLHAVNDYIAYSLQKPATMVAGFFGFVGSLSFMEDDPYWPAIFSGVLLTLLAIGLLFFLYKKNTQDFFSTGSLLLFFSLCLAACTLTRVSTYDLSSINNPHYKVYSLPLWAITVVGIYKYSTSKTIKGLLVFLAAVIFATACLRYLKPISEDSQAKRDMMTEWTITGEPQALGYTAVLPYSHESLFNSIREGYYSPFDSQRGVLDQPKKIEKIASCIDWKDLPISRSTLVTEDDSIAFAITPSIQDEQIAQIMLCGRKHHFIIESNAPKRRMVVDKTSLPADEYRLLTLSTNHSYQLHPSTLRTTGEVPRPRCNMDYPGYRLLVVAPLVYNLLCPQASSEPFDRKNR